MLNIAINGCGRIGRHAIKLLQDIPNVRLVAVNDLTEPATLAHLLRHDTVYRTYAKSVASTEKTLVIEGVSIPVYAEKDPSKLPWHDLHVDVVLECTGRFTDREGASAHLKAGAKHVVISAPTKSEDVPTFVLGVNEVAITGKEDIVSNASCTTNCLAPVMALLDEAIGIQKSLMTTIHSYTASQVLQDSPAKDLREARAAAENIVPTSTGAAKAVAKVLPSMNGRFDGLSVRVPTPVVSLCDCTMLMKRTTSVEEITTLFLEASHADRWNGLISATQEPLVSSDFIGNSASAIVDLALTRVVDGDLVKVVAWYDNEWGYAHRLVELAILLGQKSQTV